MVTSFDVAKLAGVSQPTVSRALRADPRVSTRTRERVEAAATLLGYVPSAAGRALSLGRSNRVGLLVTDLSNEFYHRVIGPVVKRVQERGLELVLFADDSNTRSVADKIVSLDLEGVILATASTDSEVPQRLRERGIPFVYFNRVNPSVPADAAVVDPAPGLLAMLDGVLDAGHTALGLVLGPDNATTGTERAKVLDTLLLARGVRVPEEARVVGEFSVESGRAGLRTLMELDPRPTAVICGNDVIAMGVINEAVASGRSVPGDLSVVGFDNLPEASWPVFALATVSFDLIELATSAVDLLLDRIREPKAPFRTVTLPSTFVTRGSLAPVSAG